MFSRLKPLMLITLFVLAPLSWSKEVKINFVQLNDVYELTPVNGGKYGGLARVKTFVDELKEENPNTYTVLSGDVLSPSAIGAAVVNGKPIGGEQMVDVFNQLGLDFMTPGNHEFDRGIDFVARMEQAEFQVISSNLLQANGEKFDQLGDLVLMDVEGAKVGVFGIMLRYDVGRKGTIYKTTDQFKAARAAVRALKQRGAQIIIAITHQSMDEDIQLAEMGLDIDVIMGGHEHENILQYRGPKLTAIAKADANARSAFLHRISYNTETEEIELESVLKPITSKYEEDEEIAEAVSYWKELAFQANRDRDIEPTELVVKTTEDLVGLESAVRTRQTNLGQLVAKSAYEAFPKSEFAIVNGGSIRVDDILPAGDLVVYDILRILPFGGDYSEMEITGASLITLLGQGKKQAGTGAYLQYYNLRHDGKQWYVGETPVDPAKTYRAAIASYILKKGDQGLFILKNKTGVTDLKSESVKARDALIATLRRQYAK